MRRLLKWVGYIIGGLLAIIVIFVASVYAITSSRMGHDYPTEVEAIAVPTDPVAVERGHHLVLAVGKCSYCHGDNLGGKVVADDAAFAKLWASNLTRGKGGIGSTYTDADYVRSIRYGVRANGKPLIFMPSMAFTHFSDSDLGSMIAYLKTIPPVDQTIPPPSIGPIARIISIIGDFPLLPARQVDRSESHPAAVQAAVTKDYGEYLMKTGLCTSCHNADLSGGNNIEGVSVANLTPTGLGKWSQADFMKALRLGTRPDGRILSAVMPWPSTKNLTDDEIKAMWMYVQSMPPRQTGG